MPKQPLPTEKERKSISMEKGAIEIVEVADADRRNRNFSLTVNQIIYEWDEQRKLQAAIDQQYERFWREIGEVETLEIPKDATISGQALRGADPDGDGHEPI